jgi:hypothetical protein
MGKINDIIISAFIGAHICARVVPVSNYEEERKGQKKRERKREKDETTDVINYYVS